MVLGAFDWQTAAAVAAVLATAGGFALAGYKWVTRGPRFRFEPRVRPCSMGDQPSWFVDLHLDKGPALRIEQVQLRALRGDSQLCEPILFLKHNTGEDRPRLEEGDTLCAELWPYKIDVVALADQQAEFRLEVISQGRVVTQWNVTAAFTSYVRELERWASAQAPEASAQRAPDPAPARREGPAHPEGHAGPTRGG